MAPTVAKDPLLQKSPSAAVPELRRSFELVDSGYRRVPKRYRKYYRKWLGKNDELAPNEVLCPICRVVIRSGSELHPGDRVFCLPCMSRLVVVRDDSGMLIGKSLH